jgi:DNA-binding winged helix-turn-helix (wHTH) protein/predicted ATPase
LVKEVNAEKQIFLGAIRLDLVNECLWREEWKIPLGSKDFAVLLHLVKHPNCLTPKEELLEAVWPDTIVSEGVLKVSVRKLRRALGDDPKTPRFIETVHRRGYRFIGPITEEGGEKQPGRASGRFAVPLQLRLAPTGVLVGRDATLAQLQDWLELAMQGERQVIFVTGEAGIGKTTLVESLLLGAARDPQVWIAQGQCLEQYGVGEAYLPVLEAVSRLCQEPGHERLLEILRLRAPTWLRQMPWLVSAADYEAFEREAVDTTRERMLREMAETIEALTARTPLVLVLEDLHWSDYSTLDLISYLARRREPARLLLVGTYRPAEMISSGHPLKAVQQELKMHRRCEELALEFLTEGAVGEYLAARFPDSRIPAQLARLIHERTDGSPLFMVNVVDYLVAQRLIAQIEGKWEFKAETEKIDLEAPENILQMIEKQVDRLDKEEQRVLHAASVAGAGFSAGAVAAALEEDVVRIEDCCEGLARRCQFLKNSRMSELPDGTSWYGFIHTLYQNTLYHRIPAARRAQLHRRIGEYEEACLGESAAEIAVELAMHFEQGREFDRAVNYLQQAADNANRRFAHQEAVMLARRGIELLKNLPDTDARVRRELALQMALCLALSVTQGYGVAMVEQTYNRARELCERLGESIQLFRTLHGLRNVYLFRAEFKMLRDICGQLLRLAQSSSDAGLLAQANWAMGDTLFHMGEFVASLDHCEQGLALCDPRRGSYLADPGSFPGIPLRCNGALAQWVLGYPDQSLNKIREALALAKDVHRPENRCITIFYAAFLYQFRRDANRTLELAEDLIAQASEYGLAPWIAVGMSLRGWARAELDDRREGIAQMRQALIAHGEAGSEIARLHFRALLAEALMKDDQIEEGLALVDETLNAALHTGGYYFLAELYRIKGELLLNYGLSDCGFGGESANLQRTKRYQDTSNLRSEAEECFHQSIRFAQRQSAKSLELRAVLSLSHLWQRQNKTQESRQMLLEIYNWFTEGFDMEDLKEARMLLRNSPENP